MHPQTELVKYCQAEGIVVQAYASLGGQDIGKKGWDQLLGKTMTTTAITTTKTETIADSTTTSRQQNNNDNKKSMKKKSKTVVMDIFNAPPIIKLAQYYQVTSAQILLRWAIDQNVVIIPKTLSIQRLYENSNILHFQLTIQEIQQLVIDMANLVTKQQQQKVRQQLEDDAQKEKSVSQDNDDNNISSEVEEDHTRLCWRNDPLRHLKFL